MKRAFHANTIYNKELFCWVFGWIILIRISHVRSERYMRRAPKLVAWRGTIGQGRGVRLTRIMQTTGLVGKLNLLAATSETRAYATESDFIFTRIFYSPMKGKARREG